MGERRQDAADLAAAESARLDTELAGRQQALGQVLARLDEATCGVAPGS